MPTVVKMPKWGLTMTAGTVTDWFLAEGAEVTAGQPLLTVETEKAVNDVEAPAAGILLKIVALAGVEVAVSRPLAIIAAPGEALSDDELAALIAAPEPAAVRAKRDTSPRTTRDARLAARDESGRINASPAARRRAQELGIDLAMVDATGPGGRITSDDVERTATEAVDDPSPREELLTLANGFRLFTLRAGPSSGTNLVFLHGLGGSQSTWQVVLGELAERYRVTAVDLPGHGQSDKPSPEQADYSVPTLSATIADAISTMKSTPAILVGHSLGGAIALQIGLDRPDLVSGLVLVDSAGLGKEISLDLLDLMDDEPGTTTARGLLELFYENRRFVVDRAVEEMAQMHTAPGAWAAQRAVANSAFDRTGQRLDLISHLSEISTPALLVWGAEDRVLPLQHAVDATRALPDAILKIMPEVGHVPQVESARALANAIDRLARSLDR